MKKLMTAHFEVDGKKRKIVPYTFSEILFFNKNEKNELFKVTFENYIINPFPGFDFHEKWNKGIKPCEKIMYGRIVGETKGMYQFDLHSKSNDKTWCGWCPKKSCTIEKIN